MKFLGLPYKESIKAAKNDEDFDEDFLSGDGFEVALVNFCFYDYGANEKAIEKIATDGKDYYECSLCVIVCCITIKFHQ